MTVNEKRIALTKFCDQYQDCLQCGMRDHGCNVLYSNQFLMVDSDSPYEMGDDEIERFYDVVFRSNGKNVDVVLCDETATNDPVNRPSHYTDGKIEVIDFIEDKKLGFCLGNAVKYIARAGKKHKDKEIEDLRKAIWYINRRIKELEETI